VLPPRERLKIGRLGVHAVLHSSKVSASHIASAGGAVKLEIDPRLTTAGHIQDPTIDAVFTDQDAEYTVERHPISNGHPFAFRLAIKRFDTQPVRSWRVLQDIKNEVAGSDRYAVEIYPPESKVTDTANIYHLWVFEEGCGPTVGLLPPDAVTT
jgi:hypothetical protein